MNYVKIILLAAKKAQISGAILLAICTNETGLRNIVAKHDGHSASYGICQVKVETAKFLGFKGSSKNLMNPSINAKYAALYLKHQYKRYDKNLCKAIAAFNAGRYNESKVIPNHPRNLGYVNRIRKLVDKKTRESIRCRD